MKKNSKVKKFWSIIFSLLMVVFASGALVSCSFGNKTSSSYSFSGYVHDELGNPVPGVEIKTDYGTTTTNENGKYTILGVTGQAIVEASKSGYQFAEKSKTIKSQNDDANFVAYEEYLLEGYVNNNGYALKNVRVIISSLSGEYETISGEDGYFVSNNVAGPATISCEYEGLSFFPATASIESASVSIGTTSSFTLNLCSLLGDNIDLNKIKVVVNGEEKTIDSVSCTFDGIGFGTTVTIMSDDYQISETEFVITQINEEINVDLSRLYSVSGIVVSGETAIASAQILVNGAERAITDENGEFLILNLTGESEICAVKPGFEFAEVLSIHSECSDLVFDGTKSVNINVDFDYVSAGAVEIISHEAVCEGDSFTLSGLKLGEKIELSSSEYQLSKTEVVVDFDDEYTIRAFAKFNVVVEILGCEGAELVAGGVCFAPEVTNLGSERIIEGAYGELTLTAQFENYVFEDISVDYSLAAYDDEREAYVAQVAINYQIPYDINIFVHSNELELSGATITLSGFKAEGGKAVAFECELLTDSSAQASFSGAIGDLIAVVSAEGYDEQTFEILSKKVIEDAENFAGQYLLNANLSYTITGALLSGSYPVIDASITATDFYGLKTSTTSALDGTFKLSELYGENAIVFAANYYKIDSASVSCGEDLVVNCSYFIEGTVTGLDGIALPNVKIWLYGEDDEIIETYSDEEGVYTFEGYELAGEYRLFTVSEGETGVGVSGLLPVYHTVNCGGIYNFSLSGFKVSGYIYCGSTPLSGVCVTAGDSRTYTNASGYYVFELLTEEVELTFAKDGYDFESISVGEENLELNVFATYTVSGTTAFGTNLLGGTKIFLANSASKVLLTTTDENGEFEISGLSGENTLSFEKDGYSFDNITINECASLIVICKIIANISAVSGSLGVSGFNAVIGSERVADVGGVVTVIVEFGEAITFEKEGYNFSSVIIENNFNYVTNASYTVAGHTMSGGVMVGSVAVSLSGEIVAQSNADGYFEIGGLVGECELEFSRTGFDFGSDASLCVSGAALNVEVQASYTVSGVVTFAGEGLGGVEVTITYSDGSTDRVETDEFGYFKFEGVFDFVDLEFDSEDYEIAAVAHRFEASEQAFEAYINLIGVVASTSGDENEIIISGAALVATLENGETIAATSNKNGVFELVYLYQPVTKIEVSASGYNGFSFGEYNSCQTNLIANLSYDATITFDETGVEVFMNDANLSSPINGSSNVSVSNTSAGMTIVISGIYGTNIFYFKKTDRTFSSRQLAFTAAGSKSVECLVSYTVSGTVKTKTNGLAASNVTVTDGTNVCITGADGSYSLSGVAGEIYILLSSVSGALNKTQVTASGTYDFTISDSVYAYFLHYNGYDILDNSDYVQIYGSGSVVGDAGIKSTTQGVYTVYKRDINGNIIKQNLNYGDAVSLGVKEIDPKVSLLVTKINGTSYLQKVEGSAVTSSTTANHTASGLSQTTDDAIYQSYGSKPSSYSSYQFSSSDASSSVVSLYKDSSGKAIVDSAGNPYYTFTLSLSTNQTNYQVQIQALAPSGTSFNGFSSINLTYVVNSATGEIFSVEAKEAYKITQIVSVSVTSTIVYKFSTSTIGNIDISSDSALTNSLKKEVN